MLLTDRIFQLGVVPRSRCRTHRDDGRPDHRQRHAVHQLPRFAPQEELAERRLAPHQERECDAQSRHSE